MTFYVFVGAALPPWRAHSTFFTLLLRLQRLSRSPGPHKHKPMSLTKHRSSQIQQSKASIC